MIRGIPCGNPSGHWEHRPGRPPITAVPAPVHVVLPRRTLADVGMTRQATHSDGVGSFARSLVRIGSFHAPRILQGADRLRVIGAPMR